VGFIDNIIFPENTRPRVIKAFSMLAKKRDSNPQKRHGNVPL
jgi:propionyl-CoA carboxylase beta chain